MAACAGLLWVGRFRGLDLSIKVIVGLLGVSTLLAAAVSLPRADFSTFAIWPGGIIGTVVPFAFLLALVGWMPTAIDVAAWSSLWTLAKNEASGQRCTVETARQDFLIGYFGTAALAPRVIIGTLVFESSQIDCAHTRNPL